MSDYRNYEEALRNLRDRRSPDAATNFSKSATLNAERFNRVQEGPATKLLIGAMEPIEDDYTQTSYEQAARVENQIQKSMANHGLEVEFDYQGSVTKDTHIRGHSDIDLLTLEKRFFTVERPQTAEFPYSGEPLDDLRELREIASSRLDSSFPEATVDTSGAKSFKISGGSLRRTIDVVPANWYNTNAYKETGSKVFRGIHLYDCHSHVRIPDQPFIHGHLLDQRDRQTNGGLRRLVRLCKTLSAEAPKKDMPSSYDIEALIYAMDSAALEYEIGLEVALAKRCEFWLARVCHDPNLRSSLNLPDGKRRIFEEGHTTPTKVLNLFLELSDLLQSIEHEWTRSRRTLIEGRVNEPSSSSVFMG